MGEEARKAKLAAAHAGAAPAGGPSELPERWSTQRKTELVLRLLRGEALVAVSRESQVPARELESWKRIFLETGAWGLKSRAEPDGGQTRGGSRSRGLTAAFIEGGSRTSGGDRGGEAAVSPSTGWRYPLTLICETWRVPRSSVYATLTATPATDVPTGPGKRGPKRSVSDADLVSEIRAALATSPFHGEGYRKDVARGVTIRCDWGPQYIADAWITEVKWLGMTITPSYVGEPECNGVMERFIRTLKEQCLYLHRFESLEEARVIIAAFIARYNTEWLIERLGHRPPAQARAMALRRAA